MLLRLILTVMMMAFALPGAACAGSGAVTIQTDGHAASMHHHGNRVPAPQQHQHRSNDSHCIGCIPLTDWQGPDLNGPVIAPAAPRVIALQPLTQGQTAPPALPPPRLG